MTRRKLIAGNWKMNGMAADLAELSAIAGVAGTVGEVDVAICLPATLIERAARAAPALAIGGQDLSAQAGGAFTGDISATMLADAGASVVIVGHSERRQGHGERDVDVRAKAEAALTAGLAVILCVGESDQVRASGDAIAFVDAQLDRSLPRDCARLAVAYEPIWAIGTGKVAGETEIGEMHSALRERLVAAFGEAGERVRILYGGSVKPDNAAGIFAVPDVDGALVGGASLKCGDFEPIIRAAR